MAGASTSGGMSLGLLKVVERARREPEGRFHSLAHLIDVPALGRAYDRMRKDGIFAPTASRPFVLSCASVVGVSSAIPTGFADFSTRRVFPFD